ncbi:MAG TPA: septal ring lytic transglycosylase RlpA family protein [Candidatus Hydrogenedentes bacterium]|nr:septal ring lytic transglycosylase RlpA family protein [Candidatus Hydrogenedentota bacterium]HOV72372.1 septal ring lytic transglycosylase RlpA family protein [Candidatus Hydrogenedentota bacterium]HPC16648.1 septal ring lytic transglycosylase RlpA family protein [Candidatus Hydrogenedentota bacterium]HRT22247.1 septal ring lytic transglycosylase RlpA family protein [Candidatus Hydrogenedentota bacterium]HRT63499.1 septal ring lytic transglycosylase RlpA family protein [Candidatus Hydrogene
MLELLALMIISQQPLQHVAQGKASYYTVSSSGVRTASGDRLNDALYTCAMRKGDFGAYYLVVAENGNSVVCKLNDRGPYTKGRVVDLSEAAMRQLDTDAGILPVKVYRIDFDGVRDLFGLR